MNTLLGAAIFLVSPLRAASVSVRTPMSVPAFHQLRDFLTVTTEGQALAIGNSAFGKIADMRYLTQKRLEALGRLDEKLTAASADRDPRDAHAFAAAIAAAYESVADDLRTEARTANPGAADRALYSFYGVKLNTGAAFLADRGSPLRHAQEVAGQLAFSGAPPPKDLAVVPVAGLSISGSLQEKLHPAMAKIGQRLREPGWHLVDWNPDSNEPRSPQLLLHKLIAGLAIVDFQITPFEGYVDSLQPLGNILGAIVNFAGAELKIPLCRNLTQGLCVRNPAGASELPIGSIPRNTIDVSVHQKIAAVELRSVLQSLPRWREVPWNQATMRPLDPGSLINKEVVGVTRETGHVLTFLGRIRKIISNGPYLLAIALDRDGELLEVPLRLGLTQALHVDGR